MTLVIAGMFVTQALQPAKATAAAANTLNFQARLETVAGAIAADGNYNVRFKLYSVNTGGTAVWTESYLVSNSSAIRTANGYITANLGTLASFPNGINWGQQLYLTMEVGGTGTSPTWDGEMSPRLPLTSVPSAFALNSYNAGTGFTGSLTVAQPTGGSQTFVVPDQGVAGNFTLLTTTAANTAYIQNQIASPQTTSNFSISGVGRAATSLQAPQLDTATAGTLGIGTTTATAVMIGKTGVITTIAGPLTSSGTLSVNGGLTVASSTVLSATVLSLSSTGLIGSAATTVDVSTNFNISATATNLTFTLPTPTASTTAGRIVYVSNVGSNSFTMYGSTMDSGTTQSFVYNGSVWTTNGAGPSGNYIQNNASATPQVGNINIQSTAAGIVTQSLRAINSQTADFLQLQDVNGNSLVSFESNGRLRTSGTPGIAISGLTAPTLNRTTGTAGTSFYYYVAPYNDNTIALPNSSGLGFTSNSVTFSWTSVAGVLGYRVYRSTSATLATGNIATLIGTVGPNTTSFTDTAITGSSYTLLTPAGTSLTLNTGLQSNSLLFVSNPTITLAVNNAGLNLGTTCGSYCTGATISNNSGGVSLEVSQTQSQGYSAVNGTAIGLRVTATSTSGATAIVANSTAGTAGSFTGGSSTRAALVVRAGTNLGTMNLLEFRDNTNNANTGGITSGGQLFYQSGSFTSTLTQANLSQNQTITIPASSAVSDTVCLLTLANCGGGTIGGSGTANYVARFTGASTLATGLLYDSGTFSGVNISAQLGTSTFGVQAASGQTGVVVQGNGTQNIAEFKNSAGTTTVSINQNGFLTAGNGFTVSAGNTTFSTLNTAGIVTNTAAGLLGTVAAVPVTSGGTGVTTLPTNGQLLIGNGTGYSLGTLTVGSNIAITNAAGSITVATVQNPSFSTSVTTPILTSAAGAALSVDSGTTGALNIGTGANAKTITIGNNTGATSLNLTSGTGGISLIGATNINTSGTAGTVIGNTGASLVVDSSGLRVSAAGVLTIGLGTTNTGAILCQNATSQIAACTTTATGAVFVQGGNSFGTTAVLGTNDNNSLVFRTNSGTRLTITNTGELTANGALNIGGLGTFSTGLTVTGAVNLNTSGTATSVLGNATSATTIAGTLGVTGVATFSNTVVVAAGQTINLVGGATNTRPVSPTEGMLYFDSTIKRLITYSNGKWQADRGDAVYVASSTSSQSDKDAADYLANGNTAAANDGDQVEINQAVTAAAGAKVVLLAGTYTIDGSISLPNNSLLSGVGNSTVVELASMGSTSLDAIRNSDASTATNITIQNLKLDGRSDLNTSGAGYNGISFNGVGAANYRAGGSINNVQFVRFANAGVYAYNASANNNLSNNIFSANGQAVYLVNAAGNTIAGNIMRTNTTGLLLTGSSNNTINTNNISNNTATGVSLTSSSNNVINANSINNNATGIALASASGSNALSDNYVNGNTASITISSDSNNNALADNTVSNAISNASAATLLNGQTSASNYLIQPAGTIELMKSTNVTGALSVSAAASLNGSATVTGALNVLTATASDDQITVSITPGGTVRYTGTITSADLTAARTWTLPNESGTLCTNATSGTCASLYIQNQNAAQQASSNYWISGTGRADTAFSAPLFDTPTAALLNIGTNNATGINLNKNVVVAAGQSLTLTGGTTANRPVGPTEGTMYYDTTTKKLLIYSNGKWQADRSSNTRVVGTSVSGGTSAAIASIDADGADYINTNLSSAQTTINSALSSLGSAGGSVYLMEGTYIIDGPISIPNNTSLIGSGSGTVIKLKNAIGANADALMNTDQSTGTGITVSNLRLNGNKANQTSGNQSGIAFSGMGGGSGATARVGARFSNLYISNFLSVGMYLSGSYNNTVTNVTMQANNSDGLALYSGSSNNTFTGNSFIGNGSNGVTALAVSVYNTFTNNLSQGNTSNGFFLSASGNNSLTGNTVQANGGNGILVNSSNNNTVSGNTIQANTTSGVNLAGSNTNTVSSNAFADNGGSTANNALYIDNADSNLITSNSITDSSATATNFTINIFNATADTNYFADNLLGGGTINNAGTNTIFGGQLSSAGNYTVQPTGTIELLKATNVTGNLAVNGSISTGATPVTRIDNNGNFYGTTATITPTTDATNVFQVQNASAASLLAIDTTSLNLATNGGAENNATFATNWTAVGGSTVTRTTVATEFISGTAAVKAVTNTTANSGAEYNLGAALAISTTYNVSFSMRSSVAANNVNIVYLRNGSTADGTAVTCTNPLGTSAYDTAQWRRFSCSFTTSATVGTTGAALAIYQGTAATRSLYIDNFAISRQYTDGTLSVSQVRIGGAAGQGLTLLTVDTAAAPPTDNTTLNSALVGSIYYDTTNGALQCYGTSGWGACGVSPNVGVNLIPEYSGAVLNGDLWGSNDIGTLTSNFCSGSTAVPVNKTTGDQTCPNVGDDYNYYKWTSPQATGQTYSVFVRYQMPATFKTFTDNNTVSLSGRTTSVASNGGSGLANGVQYGMYYYNTSTGTLTQCGSTTTVTTAANAWAATSLGGAGEQTCTANSGVTGGIAANSVVLFRIDVTASASSNAYVSNLSFLTVGK